MSTRATLDEVATPEPVRHPGRARALLVVGAAALLVSLLLAWDGGLRDQLSAADIATARRNGVLSAFDVEPSSAFGLLFPFGLALLGVAALAITVAVRGLASRAEPVVLAGALLCTLSLTLRGLLGGAPGVPAGSLLATAGLLVALPAATRLPRPAEGRGPAWPVLALGLVAAALLTGMVHDAYDVVDIDEGVLGGYGVNESAGWPQTWLAAPVGSRTLVDLALILVATAALVAAALAAARRLERPAAIGLVAFAALTLLGLLVLALGPNPGVSGVDRFPAALGAIVALLAIAPLALLATRAAAVVPEEVPEPTLAPPSPPPPPERIAPSEAWAHPSVRPRGWWS